MPADGAAGGNVTGWLFKKGKGSQAAWKKRWFVLRGFELCYAEEDTDPEPKTVIVSGVTVDRKDKAGSAHNYRFCLRGKHLHRDIWLAAATPEDRERWVRSILAVAKGGAAVVEFQDAPPPSLPAVASPPRNRARTVSPQGDEEVTEEDDMTEVEEIEEYEESEEFSVSSTDACPDDDVDGFDVGPEDEGQLKFETLPLACLRVGRSVSAMTVGSKLLVCGTRDGEVCVTDVRGTTVRQFSRHEAPIVGLSMDLREGHVAACAADGTLSVTSVYDDSDKDTQMHRMDFQVTAVALCPEFATQPARAFVAGGRGAQLVLSRKSSVMWRDREKKALTGAKRDARSRSDSIYAVKWRGDFIVWADDEGIKVYDTASEQVLLRVNREPGAPRAALYRCHIDFASDTTVLVSWANWTVACAIKERPAYEMLAHNTTQLLGEVTYRHTTPSYRICGQALLGDKLLLVTLPDPPGGHAKGAAPPPELRVVRCSDSMRQEQVYRLQLRNYADVMATDVGLVFNGSASAEGDEPLFIITSPHEVLTCRPCDADDHVAWLISNKRFCEAMRCARSTTLSWRGHTVDSIGEQHIDHLVQRGRYKAAAQLFPDYLGSDVGRWERWICDFAAKGQLGAVVPVIPTHQRRVALNQMVYEMVLHYYLETDAAAFHEAIRAWPPPPKTLYRVNTVINTAERRLQQLALRAEPESRAPRALREAQQAAKQHEQVSLGLAVLFERLGWNDRALKIYLELNREDVFDFIEAKQLHHDLQDNIELLMRKDEDRTLRLLIEHQEHIPVHQVVDQLERAGPKGSRHLFLYLHKVSLSDAAIVQHLHGRMVELYAEFMPSGLTRFLREVERLAFSTVKLDEALQAVRHRRETAQELPERDEKDLWRAEAFLVARSGEREMALKILVQRIRNVQEAIQFISEDEDKDLFELLVDWCFLGGAEFVSDLLEHICEVEGASSCIDPIKVIKRIKPDMLIPKLRHKLLKIINDKKLSLVLRLDCLRVLKTDCAELTRELVSQRGAAISVRLRDEICVLCSQPLQGVPVLRKSEGKQERYIFMKNSSVQPRGVVLFPCQHSYHSDCFLLSWTDPQTGKPIAVPEEQERSPTHRLRRYGGRVVLRQSAELDPFVGRPPPQCLKCYKRDKELEKRERERAAEERRRTRESVRARAGASLGTSSHHMRL